MVNLHISEDQTKGLPERKSYSEKGRKKRKKRLRRSDIVRGVDYVDSVVGEMTHC